MVCSYMLRKETVGLHEYIAICPGHCSAETVELDEEKGFIVKLV